MTKCQEIRSRISYESGQREIKALGPMKADWGSDSETERFQGGTLAAVCDWLSCSCGNQSLLTPLSHAFTSSVSTNILCVCMCLWKVIRQLIFPVKSQNKPSFHLNLCALTMVDDTRGSHRWVKMPAELAEDGTGVAYRWGGGWRGEHRGSRNLWNPLRPTRVGRVASKAGGLHRLMRAIQRELQRPA